MFALDAAMFEAATLALPDPVAKFPNMPPTFHQLLTHMLAPTTNNQPTTKTIHTNTTQLTELFSDNNTAAIKKIEVELVDISHIQNKTYNLNWMPPKHTPRANQTITTPHHHKNT